MARNFFALILLGLAACSGPFSVKTNLAGQQITQTALVRKPDLQEPTSIFPKYRDYLEGYLQGGVIGPDGKPLAGVLVNVQDEKGQLNAAFVPSATDNGGLFRLKFALPVEWDVVDFVGVLNIGAGWTLADPEKKFRIFYDRHTGVLAYTPVMDWHGARKEEDAASSNKARFGKKNPRGLPGVGAAPSSTGSAAPAKNDDPFANFGAP